MSACSCAYRSFSTFSDPDALLRAPIRTPTARCSHAAGRSSCRSSRQGGFGAEAVSLLRANLCFFVSTKMFEMVEDIRGAGKPAPTPLPPLPAPAGRGDFYVLAGKAEFPRTIPRQEAGSVFTPPPHSQARIRFSGKSCLQARTAHCWRSGRPSGPPRFAAAWP